MPEAPSASSQAGDILLWSDHHIDFAGDQGVDCLGVIQIHELGGGIQSISCFQNFQHKQSQGGSRQADGNALATELRKKRNRLRVPVENEYRGIEYSTQ